MIMKTISNKNTEKNLYNLVNNIASSMCDILLIENKHA